MSEKETLIVIGGGPAGLRAAEIAALRGMQVVLCEGQAAVGRKFLVAGRGGLNLTHSEAVENFPARYRDEPERWRDLLEEFGPDNLRQWTEELAIETYVGTSKRVFPRGEKAARLLRAWVNRLQKLQVTIRTGYKLEDLTSKGLLWEAKFANGEKLAARAVVLALGGASWPETGSDGKWTKLFHAAEIELAPFVAANCGWNVAWPNEVLAKAEGLPLKNLKVSAGDESVFGELLITRYGLEGGAIYRLGPILRNMSDPELRIDFKPQVSAEVLGQRAAGLKNASEWFRAWKLSLGAIAILETLASDDLATPLFAVEKVKDFKVKLLSPRPLAEAISTAGGVRWSELSDQLMLRKLPGIFLAGEMIDWEAPTGGYLLQGCFSTGTRAGTAAADYCLRRGDRIT